MANELLQNMMKLEGDTSDPEHASTVDQKLRPESADAYSNLKSMFSGLPLSMRSADF